MMLALPEKVVSLLAELHHAGYEAHAVGGCVRDMLMSIPPHDFDITTSATPEDVMRIFSDNRVIETGLKHGTVTVIWEGEPFEITTYRIESGYSDKRHPDKVAFTHSLTEDLSRRDFTVNAIAYAPQTGLSDPFGGACDIRRGLLRCVGEPKQRFSEDALRILRLLRFSSVLGFAIERETELAAFSLKDSLSEVSAERVAAELCKLLCGKDAGRVLTSYVDILGVVIPELIPMKSFDQKNFHHIHDVLTHTAIAVDHVSYDKTVRLAALFHDIGKPSCFSLDEAGVGHFYGHAAVSADIADKVLERLKFDNATRKNVVRLVSLHDAPIEASERSVKRMLGKMTPEFFFMLINLKRADNLAQSPDFLGRQKEYDEIEAIAKDILARQECFSLKDLAINGDDLLAIGFSKGKEIGLFLNRSLDKVVSGEFPNEKEVLLSFAKESLLKEHS